jgi:hypothetical protein
MNTGSMWSLFPDRGRVFSFDHHTQTAYGGQPSLQSQGHCDWRNRKMKLTTHFHARQQLNMHKILPQHSYQSPWQPFLLHGLLYLQNNSTNYETLAEARWERTLPETFYFYKLRLLIWNLRKSLGEFVILMASGVHGSNQYIYTSARTLLKTFYFYNLRLLIWNLHKSLGEFFILMASGVQGSNQYILHNCRRVHRVFFVNLEARMYKTTQYEPRWNWTRRSFSTNAMNM